MPDDPVMIRSPGRHFTRREVLSAADFRSDLDPLRETISLGLIAQQYAADEAFEADMDALQAEAERYRVDRDLSTAEDTERWLADHSLTIEDFTAWLERRAWQARFSSKLEALRGDYDADPDQVESLLWAEVVFGDHLAGLVRKLAARAAALAERPGAGGRGSWSDELKAMERAFGEIQAEALQPANVSRELDVRRNVLVRFRVDIARFPSLDAAREAWLCVTRDGAALEDVAREAGVATDAVERFLEEFPEALQPHLLSAAAGETLPPVDDDAAFLVCHVLAKRFPDTADEAAVRARIESTLMERAAADLLHRHVTIVASGG